jgi:hypothetical protein
MDEVILERDQLKASLIQGTEKVHCDHLMKEIDEWEEKSHQRIQRVASECRNELRNVVDRFKNRITERLDSIAQELKEFREEDTFVETDLNAWTAELENLRYEVTGPSKINIIRDDYEISFITKLLVVETPDDVFEESNGNAKIADNGRVITHGFWNSYGAVRGKSEYSLGCYQFYFELKGFNEMSAHGLSFGIISKTTPMKKTSFEDTSCGWMRVENEILTFKRVGSQKVQNELDHTSIFYNSKKKDIFKLIINCDRQKLRLKNERTGQKDEIIVDINKCPFPWQLNCSVYHSSDCIRLLTRADIADTNT